MQRALRLAARGRGRVEPNPMVGCVMAKGERIIGEGYHRRFGGPHAEVDALRSAAGSVTGATAYVTLEPCSHQGKTPPCADALIEAGVGRVVSAMRDPGPEVSGRGVRRLRRAGVRVDVGCLKAESRTLNRPYLTLVGLRRPHITLKWAQSIDGQTTTPAGQPNAISGDAAYRYVHRLRARMDGIIIGVGTALADDPRLNARGVRLQRVATRIVFDSCLRLPLTSRLVRTADTVPTLVLTTRAGVRERPEHLQRLRDAGVEVVACRARSGRVDLADGVGRLGVRNMTNVLVESGARLQSAFLERGLADDALVFVAPRVIGDSSSSVAWPAGVARAVSITTRRAGSDTLHQIEFAP